MCCFKKANIKKWEISLKDKKQFKTQFKVLVGFLYDFFGLLSKILDEISLDFWLSDALLRGSHSLSVNVLYLLRLEPVWNICTIDEYVR